MGKEAMKKIGFLMWVGGIVGMVGFMIAEFFAADHIMEWYPRRAWIEGLIFLCALIGGGIIGWTGTKGRGNGP